MNLKIRHFYLSSSHIEKVIRAVGGSSWTSSTIQQRLQIVSAIFYFKCPTFSSFDLLAWALCAKDTVKATPCDF